MGSAMEVAIELSLAPAAGGGADAAGATAAGRVPGLWQDAAGAMRAALVLGHGAGAGMRHAFMEQLASSLAERGVATLRYEFPYMAAGRRAPDRPPVLEATVRAAVAEGARRSGGAPLLAGGKSMGGRMTSRAGAAGPLPGVRGLVLVGFPLHPARKPSTERADHLAGVELPMLFLQGTRDELAPLDLLRPIVDRLAPRAALEVIEGADHSFRLPARLARAQPPIADTLADRIRSWIDRAIQR